LPGEAKAPGVQKVQIIFSEFDKIRYLKDGKLPEDALAIELNELYQCFNDFKVSSMALTIEAVVLKDGVLSLLTSFDAKGPLQVTLGPKTTQEITTTSTTSSK
jgi:hypothetical protein